MKKIVGALTAIGLVAAPVAASAGTRANDVVPAAAKVQRSVEGVDQVNEIRGSAVIVAILALAAVIAGLIFAFDDNDDDSVSLG